MGGKEGQGGGLGALSWEGRGWGVGGGCKGTGNLTSSIRVLQLTPLILAYTLRSEIIARFIQQTLFYVAEMGFSGRMVPGQI